jgi:hypothetical protein
LEGQFLEAIEPLASIDHCPYPDRILLHDNLSEADLKARAKRTLTNLHNQKREGQVQCRQAAHEQLDAHVAVAYGWQNYTPRYAR